MDNVSVTCENLPVNNLLTCIYMPIVVILLQYFGKLFSFGKENTRVEWLLIFAELVKYYLCHIRLRKQTKQKSKFEYNVIKGIFVLICAVAIFYIIAVLFGAPLFSEQYETLFFATLLTVMTALPCCLHLGPDSVLPLFSSLTQFEGFENCRSFLLNINLTLFGAWLGAVVIPLDWDRPYQKWPVPCCLGALAGCFVANLYSLVMPRKVVQFRKANRFNL